MSEYQAAGGPEFTVSQRHIALPEPDDAERLRRADLFLRLPSLFSPDQPLEEIATTVAETLVEHTSAVSAAVNLVRPSDVATVAVGYANLPVGYLEAMEQARQTSEQGDWLRTRASDDRTWVLRQAPEYMLSRPEYEHMTDLIRQLPYDTLIGTPFLNRPDLMGFVFLYYTDDVAVDDHEVSFARDLARQAGPLMENAWLYRQAHRRADELEALAKADLALHESILLENVYQAMIGLAVDLFGADRSLFLTFNDHGVFHAAAARGVSEAQLAGLQEVYAKIPRSRFSGRRPEIAAVEDLKASPKLVEGVRENTDSVSSVDIPVFVRGEFFGIFVLGYHTRKKFNDEDRRLFATLATRAGLALQNAVEFRESQRRTSELDALRRADEALNASLRLEDVYAAMLGLAVDLFGADRILLLSFDDQDRLFAFASRGVPEADLAGLQGVYQSISRADLEARVPEIVIVEDLVNDERVNLGVRRLAPAASGVDIPVYVEGRFFASFVLAYEMRRSFTEEERRLFATLATRAGLALQNAVEFRESQKRTSELEALYRADEALHQSLEIESVLEAMADLATDLLGADSSLVCGFDESGRLAMKACRGLDNTQRESMHQLYQRFDREHFRKLPRPLRAALVQDAGGTPNLREAPGFERTGGSFAEIPVLVNGDVWGIFGIGWINARTFSDDDRRVFDAFAARAGLAIQNASLFESTRRRTGELEALSRVDQALHESLDLEDVYEAMLDLAVGLFGADRSLFLTFDEAGVFHAAATRGVPDEHLAGLQPIYRAMPRGTFEDGRPEIVIMEDLAAEPRLRPGIREFTSSQSTVDVNVFIGGEFFGMFVLGYHAKRTFDDNDRRLLRTLSARASLAIQNALRFRESQRRGTELEALYRADQALHTSLRLEDVLKAMVGLAAELLGASSSLVVNWDENDRLSIRETTGIPAPLRDEIQERYQEIGRERFAAYERPYRTALVEDVNTHPKIRFELKFEAPSSLAEIPVVVEDELWGFFSIGWQQARTFSDNDRRMFDAFAARASLAIQNAMLFEQAQHSASMEERQRIARELHDSVSQALYGIGLGARTARRRLGDSAAQDVIEPVEYIVQLAESGLAETRALIFELVPESLEQQGLVLALQRQAAATQARYRVQVSAFLADEPDIPVRSKEALYRIAQESLHNMAKHAEATTASLSLTNEAGAVILTVADNGRGFDTAGEYPGHFGLRSMEERARRIGGLYAIESAPGAGTTVRVTLPG